MKIKNSQKNNGFVILFAVTLGAIFLSIALGVANIAYKEIKFATNARDTNDAFFAADTGSEYALFHDKSPSTFYPTGTSSSFVLSGLGSLSQSCALVTVDKTSPPTITVISKGYNVGDVNCNSTNPNRVERELKVSYGNITIPINFALASNGASASASSVISANFPASAAINGDNTGAGWGSGTGGWNDSNAAAYPDWLEVDFSGAKNINEIDVYTLADGFPVTPTVTTSSATYGITDFQVQYDNGSGWQNISSVVGNTFAWRQFLFPTISNVTKIRIFVTKGNGNVGGDYSRIVEVEAWGN